MALLDKALLTVVRLLQSAVELLISAKIGNQTQRRHTLACRRIPSVQHRDMWPPNGVNLLDPEALQRLVPSQILQHLLEVALQRFERLGFEAGGHALLFVCEVRHGGSLLLLPARGR